jgi:hypothetical protein
VVDVGLNELRHCPLGIREVSNGIDASHLGSVALTGSGSDGET